MSEHFSPDVLILGAGAAGLMCGIEAARRDRRVLVLDHAETPAKKIRISGGGKCNFTHLQTTPKNFISDNPSFCISALKRFTPWDFLERVNKRGIPYYEKTEGQLFCETSAQDIIDLLLDDLRSAGGELRCGVSVQGVVKEVDPPRFSVATSAGEVKCQKLVVATGGLSIPKMGATGFAYDLARQFSHEIVETRAGLVPFTLCGERLTAIDCLSGVSFEAKVTAGKTSFTDGFLFTHRGLSGPSILQISNYWRLGQSIEINLLPGQDLAAILAAKRQERPKQTLGTVLAEVLPRRFSDRLLAWQNISADKHMADVSNDAFKKLTAAVHHWSFVPDGTEGYRTAEVTAGGVDTRKLSSQTMESQLCSGLHFIGECVDVTGWLGGYNFQWAWSSGWAAGQAV